MSEEKVGVGEGSKSGRGEAPSSGECFQNRLDTYYIATIVYVVTLLVYVLIAGSIQGKRFEVAWEDPIVYLLIAFSVISLVSLIVVGVRSRSVTIEPGRLRFATRFRERVLTAAEIEWISFRRERRLARDRVVPLARIKLRDRRRPVRLRFSSFERSGRLARMLRDWATANNVRLAGRSVGSRDKRVEAGDRDED